VHKMIMWSVQSCGVIATLMASDGLQTICKKPACPPCLLRYKPDLKADSSFLRNYFATFQMAVSYDFGASDFVAIGTLAWQVFRATKAPLCPSEEYILKIFSLHAVQREAEETILRSPLPPERQTRLKFIADGCSSVLVDLERLVDRYAHWEHSPS